MELERELVAEDRKEAERAYGPTHNKVEMHYTGLEREREEERWGGEEDITVKKTIRHDWCLNY